MISEKGKKLLANNIKKYRKERGLTQNELGEMVGLTGVAIMHYEKAQREAKLETIEAIASALGVTGFYLLGVEYLDLKYPELEKRSKEYDGFRSYLESLGYIIKDISEPVPIPIEEFEKAGKMDFVTEEAIKAGFVMGESCNIELSKDGKRIIYTDREFDDFENSIKESIEYQVWKKQQK